MKKIIYTFSFILLVTGCSQTQRKDYQGEGKINYSQASSPVIPTWENFLNFHDVAIANHKKLIADRKEVIAHIQRLAKLAEESDENSDQQFSKFDEAEKSIRLKKSKEALENFNFEKSKLTEVYGYSFDFLLSTASDMAVAQKKKKGPKAKVSISDPAVINKAFSQFENIETANYRGSQSDRGPFLNPSCVDKDRKFNKNCIKPWINACSKTYKSENSSLFFEGVNDEWTISKLKVTQPSQYPSFMLSENGMSESKKQEVINEWGFGLLFNACGWLSLQGYDFSFTGSHYPIFDIHTFTKKFEEIGKKEHFNAENFRNLCSSNPDRTTENLNNLISSSRIWPDFKPLGNWLKDNIANCKKVVQEMCSEVGRPFDKFAVYYNTKACDIRAVTKDDIQSDLKSWEDKNYITEASKQNHLSLKHALELCESANAIGYSWKFSAPTPDKDCKSQK